MKTVESECVSCGQPCLGELCPYNSVERYYCDECRDECKLYKYDGAELCKSCVIEKIFENLEVVENSDV